MTKGVVNKDNSFGIVGVVLGIISVVGAIVHNPFSALFFGIIGLIFSLKQKKISPNKWSISGIILNIIGIVIAILIIIAIVWITSFLDLDKLNLAMQIK